LNQNPLLGALIAFTDLPRIVLCHTGGAWVKQILTEDPFSFHAAFI